MNLQDIPTFQAGIAQSKTHRMLRTFMGRLLGQYGITMMQWAIVGLVYQAGVKGIRITELAKQLQTTNAFVTTNIKLLSPLGFLDRSVDPTDSRARVVVIAPDAVLKVQTIEKELRDSMRDVLYKKIDPEDLKIYVKVLNQLATLSE